MHARDISERKRHQELLQNLNAELEEKVKERTRELQQVNLKLKISEQLYREIARNLPKAAMFIFDKNLKYRLSKGHW